MVRNFPGRVNSKHTGPEAGKSSAVQGAASVSEWLEYRGRGGSSERCIGTTEIRCFLSQGKEFKYFPKHSWELLKGQNSETI